ncbi:MAG TPA: nitroreductase [Acidimicrobiaceae bacterium]|nr:nitroreductase [Acidimicrobiaceae bacterium]HAQ22033.1 nitroreductase [Acidimicrobiaceae bacterium]HCV35161.1 nitroreductase [Acidimicrobiaceae bacterium]|tara:strand:- start:1476 stop:2180 length:705 start_codon:yes stop_codon:yes gene_type:complete
MNLAETIRTNFSCRDFTGDPVTDDQLHRILELARFAPSGGNRQGWHVVVVRDQATRQNLGKLCEPTLRLYAAQAAAGEQPFNAVDPSLVDVEKALNTPVDHFPMFDHLGDVPVLLVISVDLTTVASMDKDLNRVGLAAGASVYPLVWNILLAARAEGLAGVLTTAVIPAEAEARALLSLPDTHAIAAMVPLGVPAHPLTQLTRKPVENFTTIDRYNGAPLDLNRANSSAASDRS